MTVKYDLMTAVSVLALATAIGATAAQAADLSAPAAPVVVAEPELAKDWTGFYLGFGLNANYGVDTLNLVHNEKDPVESERLTDFALSGVGGTVEAGYDLQVNNLVFGVNGNYDFNLKSDTQEYQKSAKTTYSETLGNGWGLGLRAGLLVNESTLVFGSVGYTSRDLEVAAVKQGEEDYGVDETYALSGYYVGAGLETKLTKDISLKAEYRYNVYGDGFETGTYGKSGNHSLSSDGFNQQQVRATLAWRF